MLYMIIRIFLGAVAAAVAFVAFQYTQGARARRKSGQLKAYAAAVFFGAVLVLYFLPVENLIIGFSTPESAFGYNNSDEIMEICEYDNCALVIAATGDGEITTHVLPKKDGKWKLETTYNRRRDVTTKNYCMVERLYAPDSDDCFIIVTHSTSGNIADAPTNVADSRNTKFMAVAYPDMITFYYGFVENMDNDYTLHVDGEKIKFE